MARFRIRVDSPETASTAWARVLDLRAHDRLVPLTRVTGDAWSADLLQPGSRFVARTSLGPVSFDDPMVVDEIRPPTADSAGVARIRKEGRVIRGSIELRVTPTQRGSRVEWEQEIRVRGVPRALGWVTAGASRAAYGMVLRRLLKQD